MQTFILFFLTAAGAGGLIAGAVAAGRGQPAAPLELVLGAVCAGAAVYRAIRMAKRSPDRTAAR